MSTFILLVKRSERLFDLVAPILVGPKPSKDLSVSEILLGLPLESHGRLSEVLRPANFLIHKGMLTPFVPRTKEKWIIAERRENPGLAMRANLLHKLEKRYPEDVIENLIWPPKVVQGRWEDCGTWYDRTGEFISVYERRAYERGIIYSPSQIEAIRAGTKVFFDNIPIDVTPCGPLNRLPTPMFDYPRDFPQFNVLYRGTKRRYDQPLAPSLYREFQAQEDSLTYRRIFLFTKNLVIETIADEFGKKLTLNEAESIMQHYKILPWTSMLDLTTDINIAKAFAAGPKESSQPHIYQFVIWNLGIFYNGSLLIHSLPFARPQKQRAIAQYGLILDTSTNNIIDQHGLLVSVTNHELKGDGSGWESIGGPLFSINGVKIRSPFLTDESNNRLKSLLNFEEFETRKSRRVLDRIVTAIERNLSFFPELGKRIDDVKNGLRLLKNSCCNKCTAN